MKFFIYISIIVISIFFSCENSFDNKNLEKVFGYELFQTNIEGLKYYKGKTTYLLRFSVLTKALNNQVYVSLVDSVILRRSDLSKINLTRNNVGSSYFKLNMSDLLINKDILSAQIFYNGKDTIVKGDYELFNYSPMIQEKYSNSIVFKNLNDFYLSDLKSDNLGNIWVSLNGGGLANYQIKIKTWVYYTTLTSNIASDNVDQIKLDKNGNIYISYYDKLVISKFNGSSFDHINVDLNYKSPTSIKAFNFDFNNILYVVTDKASLAKYENNTWVTIAEDLDCSPSKFLEIDKSNNVYGSGVSNNAGYFFFFDNLGNKKFKVQTDYPDNKATFLKIFNDSIVYFSEQKRLIETSQNHFFGIKHFDNIADKSYNFQNNLVNIVDLIKDKNKNLWAFSSFNSTITELDSNYSYKRSLNFLSYPRWYYFNNHLAIDKVGNLWVSDGPSNLHVIQLH